MPCGCSSAASGGTIITGTGAAKVTGSGTVSNPYRVDVSTANSLALTVRDTSTVDLLLTGSGVPSDPYVLRADAGTGASLRGLSDVSLTFAPQQGRVPMWTGSEATGHFEFRSPGVRYTTSTARGQGFYQGEVARDTDTQKRYEWDGGQWLPLDVASQALDASVVQNAGTVTSTTDWNTLVQRSGIYRVAGGVSTTNNAPSGATGNGTLVVFISGTSVTQTYYPFEVTNSGPYIRTKFGDTDWVAWGRASGVDLTNYYTKTASDSLYYSKTVSDQRYAVSSDGTSGITFAANVANNSNGIGKCDVVRQGQSVTFRFNITISGGKATNDNLVRLPVGFRPKDFPADSTCHNGSSFWGYAVDTDGWLRLRTSGINGGGLWGTITFPGAV